MIKRLFSKIPRDRTLLLLLAPIVALVVVVGAAAMDKGSSGTAFRATTTTVAKKGNGAGSSPDPQVLGATTVPAGDAGATPADGSTDSSGGDAGGAVNVDGPDLSAKNHRAYQGGASAPAANVLGATTVPATAGTEPATPATQPISLTTTPRTTDITSPSTTIVVPPPVVSESPISALLPMSALVAVGLGVGLLFRRRRRQERAS